MKNSPKNLVSENDNGLSDTGGEFLADQIIYTRGKPSFAETHTPADDQEQAERLEHTFHGITLPNEEDALLGAPGCQHCEVVPQPLYGPGLLRLQFPHTHTLGKVLLFLGDSNWQHTEQNGIVSVSMPTGSLAPLLTPILELMSPIEQRDSCATFTPANAADQTETNFFKIDRLPTFAAKARSEWLLRILREKRIFSVFQPIVRCADSGGKAPQTYGYECLMRATIDDEAVPPLAMIDMARSAGLLFQLDLAARRAAICGAGEYGIREKIFVNFTPNSIYNPHSCLNSTVRLIDELGFARDQIVFEIVESERLPEMRHLKRIVDYYRDNGFCVALDDVGAGFASLNVLLALRPDYVKLDRDLVRGVNQDRAKAVVLRKLLETVQELSLQTIAEGVETADEFEWVRAHGADFAQGYYFARPAVPPPVIA